MTRKEVLPAVIVLRPNAGDLWLTYLIWLPALTLCCVGFGINLVSNGLVPFDAERVTTSVFGAGFLIGWLLLVRRTLRTISAFRFNTEGRTIYLTYPLGRRELYNASDVVTYSEVEGSPNRPHYDGAKDRILHLRSGRHYHFRDLHTTSIKPTGFDRLMQHWNIPRQEERISTVDPIEHLVTNAQGLAVYMYRPNRGWIIVCLSLAIGFPLVGASYLPNLILAGKSWAVLLLCGFLGLGAYALLLPLWRDPWRALLGPSGVEVRYLFRLRRTFNWSELEGYAIGSVKVGRHDTLNPAVILYLKQGSGILLTSTMIRDVEHAPFHSFGLARLEAPRPFHLFNKVPDRPAR